MLAERLRPNQLVVWQDLPDTELVLLHPASGIYYGLNATGARLWRALAAGPRTADELADELSVSCAIDRERAAGDVDRLVAALRAADLVQLAASPEGGDDRVAHRPALAGPAGP